VDGEVVLSGIILDGMEVPEDVVWDGVWLFARNVHVWPL
jgi:hypothetical protein